jgi:hypothetical protein
MLTVISTLAAAVSAICALVVVLSASKAQAAARAETVRDRHRRKIEAIVAAIEAMHEASDRPGQRFEIARTRLQAALSLPPHLDLPANDALTEVRGPPYGMGDGTFWDAAQAALHEVSETSDPDWT